MTYIPVIEVRPVDILKCRQIRFPSRGKQLRIIPLGRIFRGTCFRPIVNSVFEAGVVVAGCGEVGVGDLVFRGLAHAKAEIVLVSCRRFSSIAHTHAGHVGLNRVAPRIYVYPIPAKETIAVWQGIGPATRVVVKRSIPALDVQGVIALVAHHNALGHASALENLLVSVRIYAIELMALDNNLDV